LARESIGQEMFTCCKQGLQRGRVERGEGEGKLPWIHSTQKSGLGLGYGGGF